MDESKPSSPHLAPKVFGSGFNVWMTSEPPVEGVRNDGAQWRRIDDLFEPRGSNVCLDPDRWALQEWEDG